MLASLALRAPSSAVDGPPLSWILVRSAAQVRRSTLGIVGPYLEISGECHDLRRMIALVGDERCSGKPLVCLVQAEVVRHGIGGAEAEEVTERSAVGAALRDRTVRL